MKKLIPVLVGLSLLGATTVVTFAQGKTSEPKATGKKKGGKKKSGDDTKKDAGK